MIILFIHAIIQCMKRHHHFIFHLCVLTIGGLIAIAIGLLYYYDLEEHFLVKAAETLTPKEYLKKRAIEEGLDYTLLHRIVVCESHWRMTKNHKSSAYGYFQIIDGTERTTSQYQEGLRKFDPYVNIDMGVELFKRSGSSPWNESKPCWGRY